MYYANKRFEVAGAHKLSLDYDSKCGNLHGHNWIITVHCKSENLDQNGMVMDFAHIKRDIHGYLDHKYLNDLFDCNPTAENIAKWICDRIPKCYRVEVQESEGNVAVYEE